MTDKYKLTATLVKAFFDGYSSAIMDCHAATIDEKYQSKAVKRAMLDHYEQLFPHFLALIVTPLALMNYTYDEAETLFHDLFAQHAPADETLRRLCASTPLYEALVEEYKRNFADLLAGRRASVQQHLMSYTHGEDTKGEAIDTDMAIRQAVKMAMNAYARGLHDAGTGKVTLHQPTIYRILADTMASLRLADSQPRTAEARTAGELFLRICGSRHNLAVMNEAMNEAYAELVEQEGIIAADDKSN